MKVVVEIGYPTGQSEWAVLHLPEEVEVTCVEEEEDHWANRLPNIRPLTVGSLKHRLAMKL